MLSDSFTVDQFVAAAESRLLAEVDQQLAGMRDTAKAVESLAAAGHKINYSHHNKFAFLRTSKENLPGIRQALGHKLRKMSTDVMDHQTVTVTVTLECEIAPYLRITYQDTVPEGGKCQIVREDITHYALVCQR